MTLSESTLKTWLELQRQLIAGLQVAYVDVHGRDLPTQGLVVLYPDGSDQTDELALAARLATRSRAPVTGQARTQDGDAAALRIAWPLQLDEHGEGAIVVEVTAGQDDQERILRLLKWAESWLRLALQQTQPATPQDDMAAIVREGLAQPGAQETVSTVLARLSDRVGCTRVALGVANRRQVRLLAVSGVAEPAARSDRVRAVERAMQEALAGGVSCHWPNASDAAPLQQALAERAGLHAVCSVPVNDGLPEALVFTFEFVGEQAWYAGAVQRCEDATQLTAPLVALRRVQDRGWWARLAGLLRVGIHELLGGTNRRRLALVVAAVLLAFLAFGHSSYRVAAPAVVEGAVQQALVAPFDGYVAEALVRAGQAVSAGELLARLDARELQNEQRRLAAERSELADERRQAVAVLDPAQVGVVEAQLAQTDARLALLDDRLARTELRAPFAGMVISGDWSRSLGVPVSRGDLLFEIAPLDAYRVAIRVSDQEIAEVAGGQAGELVLSALPREPVALRVTDIATLATDETAAPTFRVEAEMVEPVASLRPGMEGVAKITVGERRRWWIWTHALTDWLRLQLWRWWP